ncbi:MAG: hypothetical protein QF492_04780 [Candidatus Krumholzibacteria bacterium]|jgi:hypothetical protein|nr:hypothetical protein [Candidatus Krumholzibacteria bacterium]MDP6669207.1 hypothetical protein [Candidatus Krumholzibacteria bacterium]MDP6796609.1 hypothetical protein [Candidatus Krumholzibacteria bacterium]MDP7020935.1 hypothetical protein [Candidatus Krumholzibacteria bacterium]
MKPLIWIPRLSLLGAILITLISLSRGLPALASLEKGALGYFFLYTVSLLMSLLWKVLSRKQKERGMEGASS